MKTRSTLLSLFVLMAVLSPALLSGCASAPPMPPGAPVATLFADAQFAPASEPVTAKGLFDLSDEMKAYLRTREFTSLVKAKGVEQGLVDSLYQKGELNLDYDSGKTREAASTFASRSGNCLSLVIMTAAFAKELGSFVYYQNVLTDPSWSRDKNLQMVSHHVNVSF
ncbi:MAG: hypothetical protein ABIT83_04005, partial [Massilia sp.]